ncbi:hypothetical protein HU200_047774 [Digitaria exilis]|uniref:Uncharacterized protein n=1 Tax=Digitaria exilis TaxID=1010633 RepID=A0A835B2N3_9POAL|nr:hypothetical protein HU200_047774 [Digitaria exilis]
MLDAAMPLCCCASSPAFSSRGHRSPVRRPWSPACLGSTALCPSTWRQGLRTGAELFYYFLWHWSGPDCSALSALAFHNPRFVERRYGGTYIAAAVP